MEIVKFRKGNDLSIAKAECIFIMCGVTCSVYHLNIGQYPDDVVRLGEFKKEEHAEIFARAYIDSLTFVTFDEVLREALTEVKDLLPDVYEAYTQQYKSALKKYKELRPLENTGKADLAQIIVSANVFQRKLNKFIQKNIHFIE